MCATSRAMYLDLIPDLLPDQSAESFKSSLLAFIARRGNLEKMLSDNGKTFMATARWLKKLKRNQLVNNYLAKMNLEWQFNLSIIEFQFNAHSKVIGKANLKFQKLKDVSLNVKITMNNSPLGYVEAGIELPPLTPNMLINGAKISLPEEDVDELMTLTK
jgi:hypothetical protein